ncbi:ABC transporter, ATP-binding/permease protein [Lactobacillus helveticus MTCC 5463]|nr:ABC transporter, ATP-binding/permease protein [Lactobacillus helveticus MTCC 5463]
MNDEQQESIRAKAVRFKEQVTIFKRLMKFVKQFKTEMIIALCGAFLVSVINILLPRGLQYFLDHFLLHQSTSVQIILFAGLLYAIGSLLKAIIQFTYQYLFALGYGKTLE